MLSEILKSVLNDTLWHTAEKIITHYKKLGYKVTEMETVNPKNMYRPHIVCKKKYETIAIEVREKCSVESFFDSFVQNCQANRVDVKVFFAIPEFMGEHENTISIPQRNILKENGIGLITVGDNVNEDIGTVPCNRRYALDSGTSLGKYNDKVKDIIKDYNLGNCLDAIRDFSEEVEEATFALALKAASKGKINITVKDIKNHKYDWEGIINCLSASNYGSSSQTRYFDGKLSNSMKEFKDVRNLSDHKKTAKEKKDLEDRYPESMIKGVRLLRTLVSMTAKVK